MKTRRTGRPAGRGGFSLLELIISTTVLTIMVGALSMVLIQMRQSASTGHVQEQLQTMAQRALDRIRENLGRSGAVSVGFEDYPYLFQGGAADLGYEALDHPLPAKTARAGEADFGLDRSIGFVLPADADGDGAPDLDPDCELIWDPRIYSFVLVPGAVTNELQLRVDGGAPEVIAHHVERVVFDDAETSGFEVPLNAVRIRLWLRQVDSDGQIQRYHAEALIELQNTMGIGL